MAIIKQAMLDAIDNSAEQVKKLINDFDWDKAKGEFSEKRDKIIKFGADLINDVKETLGQFSGQVVEDEDSVSFKVPYSKSDNDKLKWKVEGRTLCICVKRNTETEKSSREFSFTIPEGYSIVPSSKYADKNAGVAVFSFDAEDDVDDFQEM